MGFKSGFNTYTEIDVRGNNLVIEGQEIIGGIYSKNEQVFVKDELTKEYDAFRNKKSCGISSS